MARPTDYKPEIVAQARFYLENLPEDEPMHSVEGLSDFLQIARSTIYKWKDEEGKEEFSDIYEQILTKQGKQLLGKGITGEFNPTITKVMLTKHGYRDAIDTDVTTKGKEINPTAIATTEAMSALKIFGDEKGTD
jgi:hypothetical protein